MFLKPVTLTIGLVQAIGLAQAANYWDTFTTFVDPKNITLPDIPQTTSYDPATECTAYTVPAPYTFNPAEWPANWQTATTNGMANSTEFLNLYNSINWAEAPNIPVRTLINGALDFTGYATTDDDCWWSFSGCTTPKHPGINADIYKCDEPETWGLTFDDGPNCSHNAFYDFLQEKKLTASMFYIGSNVVNWPYGAMRGVRDGHHISIHTWSHQLMTTLTNQEVLAELYYTSKAIKLVSGVTPRYWRPPFGDIDDRVRWIATQLNLTAVIWNLDTDDWASGVTVPQSTVEQNYENFITMGTNGTFSQSGNIVLEHEIRNDTMQLAMQYLPSILSAYKHVIDVATCMNITNPYMESDITFPTFDQYLQGVGESNGTSANGNPASQSGSHDNGAATKTVTPGTVTVISLVVAGLASLVF